MNDRTIAPRGYQWTTVEVAALREHYPKPHGAALCAELLPHRGIRAVYAKARHMGLRTPNMGTTGARFARKYIPTPQVDTMIREAYCHAGQRVDLGWLAACTRMPRWWVSKRAVALGLTRERLSPLPWSRAELAVLQTHPTCSLQTLRRKLREAGFHRTETAIEVKMKRLRIDRSDPDTWTGRELGQLLGVDGATVGDWVNRRGLPATRNPRGPNGVFSITRKDLRRWLVQNHGFVDLRRVDQPWFWGLVLGGDAC